MLVDAPRHRNIESAADLDERGEYELASPPPYKPNRASRQSPTRGLDKAAARLDHAAASEKSGKGGMLTGKDRRSFALLVLLCELLLFIVVSRVRDAHVTTAGLCSDPPRTTTTAMVGFTVRTRNFLPSPLKSRSCES